MATLGGGTAPVTRAYPDLQAHLPVTISSAAVDGPAVLLRGEDWELSIAGQWEGSIEGRALAWDDDDVADHIEGLVGEALLAVGDAGIDEVGFQFSNGVLFVGSEADQEPWVLRLPTATFVGRGTR